MATKQEPKGSRVTVIPRGQQAVVDRKGAVSQTLSDTAWQYGAGQNALVAPLIDVDKVCQQIDCTQSLRPVIDAVVTNVHLMGHAWVPLRKPQNDAQRAEAEAEKKRADKFFRHVNPRLSWSELRKRFGKDKESIAYALFEVLENLDGLPVGLAHRPSKSFRMSVESDIVKATYKEFDEEKGVWVDREYEDRFRVWVQQANGLRRYFREWGDPRVLNGRTGEFLKRSDDNTCYTVEEYRAGQIPKNLLKNFVLANQVIWQCTYDPLSEYGMTAWINLWLDTESDYHAADSTRDYLADGGIPKLLLVFLAGILGKSTMAKLTESFNNTKGKHAENRAVVVEAAPMVGKSDLPGVTAEAKTVGFQAIKLNDLLQGDALFREFRKDHHRRVRVARRLPGLFVGEDDQTNYATADVQVQVGTSQVFRPEQMQFDDMINSTILPALGMTWWQMKSLGPTIEENKSWVEVIRIGIESGAIPDYPTLRRILSEVVGYELPSGNQKGDLAEWEQMPPGFVKLLFQAVQGFPQFADLAAALPVDEALPVSGNETSRAVSRRVLPSVVERTAEMVLQVFNRAREKLHEATGGGA